MKKSVWYVLVIMSMFLVSSCAHVECAKIEKVKNVKTQDEKSIYDAPMITGKDLPPDKGILFTGGPIDFFIEDYYPRKCKVEENAWEDIIILPAETVEITFSPKRLKRWQIILKDESNEIFQDCFEGVFMYTEDRAPQIYNYLGIREICEKKIFFWTNKEGESMKILITNDTGKIIPLTIFTSQTTKKKLTR